MDRRFKSASCVSDMRRVVRAFTGGKTVALWSISSWQCGRSLAHSSAPEWISPWRSCSPATAGGLQTEAAATAVERFGPAVLGPAAEILAGLEGRVDRRQTQHRGRLAPGRIPLV